MATNRIESIDVLRGLTIAFMIIVNTPGSWSFVYGPLKHAEWHGCTPTDLVFPFFTFIVGMSMAQSLGNMANADKNDLYKKTLKRSLLIFLIGLFINYYPFFNKELGNLRIYGVLQRIAMAYFIASIVVITVPKKSILLATAVIALGYYVLLFTGDSAPYDLVSNIVRKFDLATIGPSHMYKGFEDKGANIPFDPEGMLGSFGTACNVLLGYYLGIQLKEKTNRMEVIKFSIIFGLILVNLGLLWSLMGLPINKPLWTSSYVLFTSGLCAILFAIVTYVMDILNARSWAFPFKVFGMNALVSFALSGLVIKTFNLMKINGTTPYAAWYKYIMSPIFGAYLGSFLSAISFCALIWLIAYTLYRKKIFLKV